MGWGLTPRWAATRHLTEQNRLVGPLAQPAALVADEQAVLSAWLPPRPLGPLGPEPHHGVMLGGGPTSVGAELDGRQSDERRAAAATFEQPHIRGERHRDVSALGGGLGAQSHVNRDIKASGDMADGEAPDHYALGVKPVVTPLDGKVFYELAVRPHEATVT